jgi:AcrR family transcriptional regulator
MAGRPRTRSDADVFAATFRAVGRHGPARLTLAGVAAEAGLAPSTLAERFGSKRGLLLAAARAGVGDVEATFARARARHAWPLGALRAALAALSRPVRSRAALAHHLAFLQLDVADPQLRRVAERHAAALRAAIRALLADAVAAGDLVADADPDRLARTVHVAYNGALVTWAIAGRGPLAAALDEDVGAVLAPWRPGALPSRAWTSAPHSSP